jgi:hypothetical protein
MAYRASSEKEPPQFVGPAAAAAAMLGAGLRKPVTFNAFD